MGYYTIKNFYSSEHTIQRMKKIKPPNGRRYLHYIYPAKELHNVQRTTHQANEKYTVPFYK